jgi:hypothetical protein
MEGGNGVRGGSEVGSHRRGQWSQICHHRPDRQHGRKRELGAHLHDPVALRGMEPGCRAEWGRNPGAGIRPGHGSE